MWGIWGSYYNIPKAIFYLLKGDDVFVVAVAVVAAVEVPVAAPGFWAEYMKNIRKYITMYNNIL